MKLVSIKKSSKPEKKLMATFQNDEGKKSVVHFGQAGADDFTKTKDEAQKALYLSRHRAREDWNKPDSPGSLARYVLWNKPTVKESIDDFKKRFSL